jgi:hypothetical protein
MHHNTLTRTSRELRIDTKEIRKEMHGRSTVNTVGNHHWSSSLRPERGPLVLADQHLHLIQIHA